MELESSWEMKWENLWLGNGQYGETASNMIQVYAPTQDYDDETIEFYEQIQSAGSYTKYNLHHGGSKC